MEQQSLQLDPPETNSALLVQTAPPCAAQNTVMPERTEVLTPEERKLVRTIPRLRNRALRREAENALKQVPFEALTPLVAALQKPFSRRWREAQVAAWALGRAPLQIEQKQEAVEALTRLLQIPATGKYRFRATLPVTVVAAILSLILAVSITFQDSKATTYNILFENIYLSAISFVFMFVFFLLPVFFPFSLMIDALLNNPKDHVRAMAAASLGRLAAPESVDVLAETLKDPTLAVQKSALRALVPLLTPAHYGQFGLHVNTALCRALLAKDDAWVLDCLDAIEKVGYNSAILAVERLVRMREQKLRRPEALDRVRERAAQVLVVLEQRKAQDNVSRHLLRASVEPSSAADILLRAAMGDNPSDGTQLLRASIDTET